MDTELKQKIKEMTWKQKISYFWEYHKWYVIIPLAVIIFLVTFITSFLEEIKESAITVAIVNAKDAYAASEMIKNEYAAQMNIDTEKTPVRVETGFRHPKVMDNAAAADTTTVTSIQKYQGMITNANIDVTVSPTWSVDEYQLANVYLDLLQVLPKEFLDQHKQQLYYAKNSEGKEVAVGICLEGKTAELFGEFYDDGTPVMTISSFTKKPEEAVRFVLWYFEICEEK